MVEQENDSVGVNREDADGCWFVIGLAFVAGGVGTIHGLGWGLIAFGAPIVTLIVLHHSLSD